jgi:formiminoglutamate deiminase
MLRRWHAELAWLSGRGLCQDVLIEASGERFTAVTPEAEPGPGVSRLRGLTLPGFANAHSHAFHRALRGITQAGEGTFWTWRERMYQVADRLDPDSYLRLARAVYAEMALAGITCVGEFHYLHHQAGGTAYHDVNAMGRALVEAATAAGLRMTLLDTCYLAGGLSAADGVLPLAGPQSRFGDGDGSRWAARVSALGVDSHGMISPSARVGAAIHSVRAVPPEQMGPVVIWTHRYGAPLHVHLSEQVAENAACVAVYGVTPTRLLYDEEVLGPRTSVVHATHLSAADVGLLGGAQAYACLCPTTERDLGDGLAPSSALASAGCRLTLGSDSHAVIDMLEEARGVEYCERLARRARGVLTVPSLLDAATCAGHASLGWPDAGKIVPGAWADLVTVRLDSVRGAGFCADAAVETAVFAATAADVRDVVIGGRDVVRDGVHLLVSDVPGSLASAIRAVTGLPVPPLATPQEEGRGERGGYGGRRAVGQRGLLERVGNGQVAELGQRPDDKECPPGDLALRNRAAARVALVIARVVGIGAIVTHHPQVTRRHRHVERHGRRGRARVQVRRLV